MKVLNGMIRATDIKGRRALVWHGFDGRTYHANIIGGRVRAYVRISYKVDSLAVEGVEPVNYSMTTTTIFKDDEDALKRIELA